MTKENGAISADVVRQMLGAQFPHWADLPLSSVDSAGVDNVMFRLGNALVVRMPRNERTVPPLRKEQVWLPRLSTHFTLPTPVLRGIGQACESFPLPWSVHDWIDGAPVNDCAAMDWNRLAADLAGFISALRNAPATGGPAPGAHNFWRGAPLHFRDAITRRAIAGIADMIDANAALAVWDRDSAVGDGHDPPRWIHGDLHAHNLLQREGRLCGVIDFGGLGVGDVACDLAAAWRLLPQDARGTFRNAFAADETSWRRGRAWALSISVCELEHYRGSAPGLQAVAQQTVTEVLADKVT